MGSLKISLDRKIKDPATNRITAMGIGASLGIPIEVVRNYVETKQVTPKAFIGGAAIGALSGLIVNEFNRKFFKDKIEKWKMEKQSELIIKCAKVLIKNATRGAAMAGAGIAGPIGATVGADEGKRIQTGLGSLGGVVIGGLGAAFLTRKNILRAKNMLDRSSRVIRLPKDAPKIEKELTNMERRTRKLDAQMKYMKSQIPTHLGMLTGAIAGAGIAHGKNKTAEYYIKLAKKDMPSFLSQDRPAKVKEIYRALKRDHPEYSAGKKARIANAKGQ